MYFFCHNLLFFLLQNYKKRLILANIVQFTLLPTKYLWVIERKAVYKWLFLKNSKSEQK
jgi:hypothetical protein